MAATSTSHRAGHAADRPGGTDLRLHPGGVLYLADGHPTATSAQNLPDAIRRSLVDDWRAGMIDLAAAGDSPEGWPLGARFWRSVATEFLTRLCHLPEAERFSALPPPDRETLQRWVDGAPPIHGGEYLSPEVLLGIWDHLNRWIEESVLETGDLSTLLRKRAPAWRRVGRVTFHLAENKAGADRPFAFLATFTSGLSAAGTDRHLPLAQALKIHAGRNNRGALIRLLTPVREAARALDWVAEMLESGELYRPTAWTAMQAHRFLRSAPDLETAGILLRIPDWWQTRTRTRVEARIETRSESLLGAASLLDLDVRVMLGDTELSPGELKALMSGPDGLVMIKGRWVEIDRDRLQEALDLWNDAAVRARDGDLSFYEGLRLLAGATPDLGSAAGADPDWSCAVEGPKLREVLERMRRPTQENAPKLEAELAATLRPYQHEGVAWLALVSELGLGACLADDMGLGKTLQVLALLHAQRRRKHRRPALLVAPASLLSNWRIEAERFTPELKLLTLHPSQLTRKEMDDIAAHPETRLAGHDLVVTTYNMVQRLEWLADPEWSWVILDEAQAIKNPGTAQSKAVRRLRAVSRIALTGTPVENDLGDLWSLFDFLNPGLLGSRKVFREFAGRLESTGFEPLRRLVGPYILRRMKTDRHIIADLPEKTETVRYCRLTPQQVRLYAKIVADLERGLESIGQGIERRGLVLQTLMRLKQVCNHPSQLIGDQQYDPRHSGKFERLEELCSELTERQEKTLVFTQYREIIPHLEEYLVRIFGRTGLTLHGGTSVRKRADLVAEFQTIDGPPFFIISLKAGGTGLNLTQACHVIHFDRWWNPAVENQATDRAFRIGQKQNVLVHKFVCVGTVEEKIDRLIEEKKALAEQLLAGAEINLTEMSDQQLLEIVRLDVHSF